MTLGDFKLRKLTDVSLRIHPKRVGARKHSVGAAFCIKRAPNEVEMQAKATKMDAKTSQRELKRSPKGAKRGPKCIQRSIFEKVANNYA